MWEPGKQTRRPLPAPARDVVVCVCGSVTKPRSAELSPGGGWGERRMKGGFEM